MNTTPPPNIDPLDPDLLTTAQASAMVRAAGLLGNPATVWKWIVKGKAGIRLPAIWVGCGYRTNREALRWFLREVGQNHPGRMGARR